MNQRDLVKLDDLLWELCNAQDFVTHLIEGGGYAVNAKAERAKVIDQIKKFVQSRTRGARQ